MHFKEGRKMNEFGKSSSLQCSLNNVYITEILENFKRSWHQITYHEVIPESVSRVLEFQRIIKESLIMQIYPEGVPCKF